MHQIVAPDLCANLLHQAGGGGVSLEVSLGSQSGSHPGTLPGSRAGSQSGTLSGSQSVYNIALLLGPIVWSDLWTKLLVRFVHQIVAPGWRGGGPQYSFPTARRSHQLRE